MPPFGEWLRAAALERAAAVLLRGLTELSPRCGWGARRPRLPVACRGAHCSTAARARWTSCPASRSSSERTHSSAARRPGISRSGATAASARINVPHSHRDQGSALPDAVQRRLRDAYRLMSSTVRASSTTTTSAAVADGDGDGFTVCLSVGFDVSMRSHAGGSAQGRRVRRVAARLLCAGAAGRPGARLRPAAFGGARADAEPRAGAGARGGPLQQARRDRCRCVE